MKIKLIVFLLLISACSSTTKKAEISFYSEMQIDNNLYLGYNADGKCIPFSKTVTSSGDTVRKINYSEYYDIYFPENNKLYCYIKTSCSVPLKISVYDLVKYNDEVLHKTMSAHVAKFSAYPKDQQLYIFELMKINDAIITNEERQKRMERMFGHSKTFSNWKFTLSDKKIETLLGIASWVDFTCEDFKFRYSIHNTVSEAYDHTLGDESHDAIVDRLENKYKTYEIGKQYTLSGVIKEDKYGFGIALGNPITIEIN